MKAQEIMESDHPVLSATDSLFKAASLMREEACNRIPVIDRGGFYVGMIDKNRVLAAFMDCWITTVEQIVDYSIPFLDPEQELDPELLKENEVLAVCSNTGELLGVCTLQRFADFLIKREKYLKAVIDALLQSSTNAIVVVDKNGYITGFNYVAEKIVGIKSEEAIGRWIGEVILETGLPDVIKSGQHQFNQRMMINSTVVITNRSPIIQNGEIVGALGTFQDISELESVSRELKSTQELKTELDAIIESSYDGIYVTDGRGKTLRVNSAYERITGVKAQEVIGEYMDDLVRRGYYSDSATLHVLKKRAPVTIMQKIKSGVEVIVTGNPIFNEKGEIIRVVTNVRDITELNFLKEQLEKTKMLSERYHSELEHLRTQQLQHEDIIVRSPEMQKVLELTTRVAAVNSTVLITGESGVGKEIIAKMLHTLSPRKDGPLIKINCGAIPENLLESELFGYVDGAFTGARKNGKPGMIELADKGTLFLDEIGEMPLSLQVKLLRVIQEHEIVRVGGTKPIKVDVRYVAATNRDLEEMVGKGLFREDLYYRLNVVVIKVPALRNRSADIPPLIAHFINKYNRQYGMNKQMSKEAIEALTNYNWPGNVRELENMIERLMIMVDGRRIDLEHLPDYIRECKDRKDSGASFAKIIPLKQAVAETESKLISSALKEYGSMEKAAKALGVARTTVLRKMQKYNLLKEEIKMD
ncbi:MAG TPA: sigma-54-dependent Fis family transcriptional regulator [Clostridia bacterium]|nr:sigma-54-dependent Fis family transcriptional regulator [Clostridia bacterium]